MILRAQALLLPIKTLVFGGTDVAGRCGGERMGIRDTEKLRGIGISIIAIGVVIAGLVLGSSFLIPLAIAVLLWNLLEALVDGFARIGVGRARLPRWFAGIFRSPPSVSSFT